MNQKQDEIPPEEDFCSLAAELAKIPKECRRQVLREAVIFIAGMERIRTLERERIRMRNRGRMRTLEASAEARGMEERRKC